MIKKSFSLLLAVGLLALASFPVAAQTAGPPPFIDYQGKVKDGSGNPLADSAPTNFEVQFRIYDEPTGGNVIWSEKQIVTIFKGQFSVRIGEGQPILAAGGAEEGIIGHASPGLPAAFGSRERHLGITVVMPGNTGEITPRLAFLSAPFAMVAGTANKLVQAPGTQSNLTVGSIGYASAVLNTSAALDGTTRTVLVDSTSEKITATLPLSAAQKELLVAKTDGSTNYVVVQAPAGGQLNGVTDGVIRLKVKGEAVTVQNVGANAWWVVNDTRDRTPVGTVVSYSSNSVPPGYVKCDGHHHLKADFPELVAVLGDSWGVVSATHFRTPDLRGAFLRGRDDGRGLDPNSSTRSADFAGAAAGDNVGSFQTDIFASHNHGGWTSINGEHSHGTSVSALFHSATGDGWNSGALQVTDRDRYVQPNPTEITVSVFSAGAHQHQIPAQGGSETRSKNYSVNYVIKY